ncbi:hypothetical protein Zmor_026784 [Zophobas morio]|uniref:Uncharacterized protein n=1 Tax=Zophobas morio TaxID=2755281 RepID=A0AA38HWA6_9CUCU|nr:hypothetical protein Zmor_026784 [Zophobas morio]
MRSSQPFRPLAMASRVTRPLYKSRQLSERTSNRAPVTTIFDAKQPSRPLMPLKRRTASSQNYRNHRFIIRESQRRFG